MRRAAEDQSYDVAVIGAGVIGLACAWRAAEAGRSVVVLDGAQPGSGASGVAAGMLAPVTEAEPGEEALVQLNLDAAARWPSFHEKLADRSGADTGYRESGMLAVAVDRDDGEELHQLHDFQRSLGLDSEWLTRAECRRLEPRLSPRIAGGILVPGDHHANPRALVRALVAALEEAGGEVRTGVAVERIESAGERVTGVRTAETTIAAEHVVAAAGCWSTGLGGIPAAALPPVRPVKGQILRLRARGGVPLASLAVRTPRCYVVTRAEGEVVVGATVEERGFDTSVTVDGVYRLLEAAREVLPDIGELELSETAARLRPGTPDNAPIVGAGTLPGLVWATGHYRNGILLAPLTADLVLQSLETGDPLPAGERFSPTRFAPDARLAAAEAP